MMRWLVGTSLRLRYLVVVAITYVGTLVVVLGGTHAGAPLLVAKTVAVALSAVFNYLVGRRWVYR